MNPTAKRYIGWMLVVWPAVSLAVMVILTTTFDRNFFDLYIFMSAIFLLIGLYMIRSSHKELRIANEK